MNGAPTGPRSGSLPPRGSWGRLLALVDRTELLALSRALASQLQVEPTAPPEAGLVLLTLRDGAGGAAFHVGEMPAAQIALRVVAPDGRAGEGGAIVAGEDLERAEAVALFDAILAADLPGAAQVGALLARGAGRAAEVDRQRRLVLARTRVEFGTLGDLPGSVE